MNIRIITVTQRIREISDKVGGEVKINEGVREAKKGKRWKHKGEMGQSERRDEINEKKKEVKSDGISLG